MGNYLKDSDEMACVPLPEPILETPGDCLAKGLGRHQEDQGQFVSICALVVWGAHLLLSPFYVFPSGLPQPADYLLLALAVALGLKVRLRISSAWRPYMLAVSLFVLDVVAVNVIWCVTTPFAPRLLLYPAYYVFNGVVCWVVISMYSWLGQRFARWTILTVSLSIGLQLALVLLVESKHPTRATALFNNPNQLGYYLVLGASLIWMGSQQMTLSRLERITLLGAQAAGSYIVLATMSRAGIVAFGVIIGLQCLQRRGVGLFVATGLILAGVLGFLVQFTETSRDRAAHHSQPVDAELEHRGYDRIWSNPEYLLFGAAEGRFDEFAGHMQGEIHSTPGTILFGYGAVGVILFSCIFYVLFANCGWQSVLYIVPAILFALTHMGLRQAEFWTMLTMTFGLNQRSLNPNGKRRRVQ